MAVSVSSLISELWAALGATSEASAVWWDAAELYTWANDTLRRMRQARIYVEQTSYTLTSGQQTYTLPSKAAQLLIVAYDGTVLPRFTAKEMDAARQTWRAYAAPEPPESVVEAMSAENTFAVVPSPTATLSALLAVTVSLPADVSAGAPTASVPSWMAEPLYLGMLAGARGRDTDGAMPEVAASIERVLSLIERAAAGLFVVGK